MKSSSAVCVGCFLTLVHDCVSLLFSCLELRWLLEVFLYSCVWFLLWDFLVLSVRISAHSSCWFSLLPNNDLFSREMNEKRVRNGWTWLQYKTYFECRSAGFFVTPPSSRTSLASCYLCSVLIICLLIERRGVCSKLQSVGCDLVDSRQSLTFRVSDHQEIFLPPPFGS